MVGAGRALGAGAAARAPVVVVAQIGLTAALSELSGVSVEINRHSLDIARRQFFQGETLGKSPECLREYFQECPRISEDTPLIPLDAHSVDRPVVPARNAPACRQVICR